MKEAGNHTPIPGIEARFLVQFGRSCYLKNRATMESHRAPI